MKQRQFVRQLPMAIAMAFSIDGARAATITVSTGGDTGSAATCTLRQAVESADNDAAGTSSCVSGSGADTIMFSPALTNSVITLANGALTIFGSLTINGSGQTVSANSASRVANVSGADLSLSNLTLSDGNALLEIDQGGGALNAASSTVAMTHVTVTASQGYYAGGILLSGSTLTATDSVISNNSTTNNSKGNGGGIFEKNTSVVTLNTSTISGNSSKHSGGGIYLASGSSLTLNGSTLSGNAVIPGGGAQAGGGIFGILCGSMTLTDSAVINNSGQYQAGGIRAAACPLTLINTTVSGNTSGISEGGGLYIGGAATTIINSTISGNTAAYGGGILLYSANVTLENTILSANTATLNAAKADLSMGGSNTLSANYSLIGSALSGQFSGSHNIFSNAPMLGPLQNNGGPTQTMALLVGSAAIDAGSNALAKNGSTALIYDQRAQAFPRIFNGKVDIGAFEFQGDRIFANGFEAGP